MYSYDEKTLTLTLDLPDHFSVHSIFDCGQCFRFDELGDGTVEGVAFGRALTLKEDGDSLVIRGITDNEFESVFKHFLALDADYNEIERTITAKRSGDATLAAAVQKGRGIRILRQDGWEALCSFIISQNNNIPRIKKIISSMSEKYGKPIGNGKYAFPEPKTLYDAGVDALFDLRTGFRAKYIYDACEKVLDGTVDLAKVREMPTLDAIDYLSRIKGVGLKVASCALLFGFDKTDAFPVDVHIKHLLAKYYPDGIDVSDFGPYAGIAQQYLFYYERYK